LKERGGKLDTTRRIGIVFYCFYNPNNTFDYSKLDGRYLFDKGRFVEKTKVTMRDWQDPREVL